MKKEKKSLIRNDGFQTLLSSLVCILGGLFVGYLVLLLIAPSGAFEAIVAVMKSFFRYPCKLMRMTSETVYAILLASNSGFGDGSTIFVTGRSPDNEKM